MCTPWRGSLSRMNTPAEHAVQDADNPLLELEGLPPFSRIRPQHALPAIQRLIEDNRALLEELLRQGGPWRWETLIQPLDEAEDRLERAWAPIRHMNAVVNTPELREAYNACLPLLSDYHTDIGQNARLQAAYQALHDDASFANLEPGQRKAIEDALRGFHLSGVDLPEADKRRFKEIQQRLSELKSKYEENVLDATHAWSRRFDDPAPLAGLPESALEQAREAARARNESGWMITLEFPSYYAVITHADDRALRREVYEAYTTRASDQGLHAGQWDNGPLMEEILELRQEAARLLGFKTYAERSLATKMAESPQQVMDFLRDLARRSRPRAEDELEELRAFAREHLGLDEIEPWDLAYAAEKLRQHKFDLSQEDLKPYFPVDRVIEGLFGLVSRLFGVEIREREGVDTWHPTVRFFDILEADGSLRGSFYLDLYARPHKRGGAWMDECISRMRHSDGRLQHPVAFLTCNSAPPAGDRPALFTHDEVITLFHEFGHGLQHMLTRIDWPEVSGINGVEWDAVELPSQFMENWCWEREALDLFARHYETDEPMPEALFDKLTESRHFHAALQMLRQIEFGLFDMRIHHEPEAVREKGIQGILDEVREEVALIRPPAWNRFQNSFSHIFAGGYAAGYYSYKWAEVLSADAFARFEEEGLFDPRVGADFLHTVLELGGSRPAMEVFRAFRGREPRIDALLRHNGLD